MNTQDIVERFITDLKRHKPDTTEAHIKKFRQRVPECIKFFEAKGISIPVDADYELLKSEFLNTHSNGRGGTLSSSSIRDWALQTKQVYDWLNQNKKGEQQMTIELEPNETIIEPEVEELQETETTTPRRGRKPNPEKANRVQVSIYLDKDTYEAVKDIATFSNQTISDIFYSYAVAFVERNREALEEGRQTLRALKKLNFCQ